MRILEDHAHIAAHLIQLLVVQLGHIDASQFRVAEEYVAFGGGNCAQDHASGGCFAAAAFSHQPECFAFFNLQADIVDGFDVTDRAFEEAALDREVLLEISDLQEQG